MFLIYGTDAPLYHYPITTSVMVFLNVFIHILVTSAGIDVSPWMLWFGDGLHPLQWITHNFLHIGYLHLFGNMLFLFPFGLVVEGKIGWARMLVLYLLIGGAQGFSQQAIMLSTDPGGNAAELVELFNDPDDPMSEEEKDDLAAQWREDMLENGSASLGASAVIFGLLAVCAVWAPKNDFEVFFRWSIIHSAPDGGIREWSVLTVCGIFVAKEFGIFLMLGGAISSQALHLNGFFVGGFIGMAVLYWGYVDCEGFDLISMYTGTKFKGKAIEREELRERMEAREAAKPTGPPRAVVPTMPHQLQVEGRELAPTIIRKPPQPKPTPAPKPVGGSAALMGDLALPDFDDGTAAADPITEAKSKMETLIASKNFTAAVRLMAETRKIDPTFVPTPASTGRLAEGLIGEQHVKPAITVLTLGSGAYPSFEPRWRIRIASLELTHNRDPMAAIQQLQQIDKEMLDSKMRQQYVKVGKLAKEMAG
ncbi:MAG: rhomboid family intramembrane serine protease [Rubripirellula sp.]